MLGYDEELYDELILIGTHGGEMSANVNVDVADYVESLTKRADEAFYDKYNKF